MLTMADRGTSSDDYCEELKLVPVEYVLYVWMEVFNVIRENSDGLLERYTEDELLGEIVKGILDLWVIIEEGSIIVASLASWDRHVQESSYHIIWIGGTNFKKYYERAIRKIERYVLLLKGTEVVISGRRGWLKRMGPLGYEQKNIQIRKNVRKAWSN